MQAHSAELAVHPVEVESGFGTHLYAADAEGGGVEVGEGAVPIIVLDIYPGISGVKLRGLGEPQAGLVYGDFLVEDGNSSFCCGLFRSGKAFDGGDKPSVGIADNCDKGYGLFSGYALNLGADVDRGLEQGRIKFCSYVGAPYGDVDFFGLYQPYIAVEAGPGIPSGGLGAVLEADADLIVLAVGGQEGGDVAVEGVVAVGPEYDFLSVDVDPRLAHGAVEEQGRLLARSHVDCPLVPADPNVWQASRASGLDRGGLLAVLDYCDRLQVIVPAERAVDGPVVAASPCLRE